MLTIKRHGEFYLTINGIQMSVDDSRPDNNDGPHRSKFHRENQEKGHHYYLFKGDELDVTRFYIRKDAEMLFKRYIEAVREKGSLISIREFEKANPQKDTCFVLRKNSKGEKRLVYIGEFISGIRKRAQDHANATKCLVALYHNGAKPEVFQPAA